MFESAEIGHRVSKSDFRSASEGLRTALLKAQQQLLEQAKFPVILLINGVDGAGKGETVNLLNEWMDPRHIVTRAFGTATAAELERPPMWRFWRALPPKGRLGILFGSWYTDPILKRVLGKQSGHAFGQRLSLIRDHERMLVAEGALLLKFWFHLSKDAQKRRLKELSSDRKTAWRVSRDDWDHFAHYDEFLAVSEVALRETSTGEAPWTLIDGSDHGYRSLTAGRVLLEALRQRLEAAPAAAPAAPVATPAAPAQDNLLRCADYARKLGDKPYERQLAKLQGKLNLLMRHKKMRKRALVMVFEGMDAAGKGSTIRRITRALDARFYQVIPIAAPTSEERAQPYLWRFWRHIPAHGHSVIFDRSWYGRVLVERVEKFCTEADWQRAYHEINEFEEQLMDGGAILAKFWLAISEDEQLRRFQERADIEYKQFKITEEDWRNRKKWPDYERAVVDMIDRTSSQAAPWALIASDDKRWARVETLKHLVDRIDAAL